MKTHFDPDQGLVRPGGGKGSGRCILVLGRDVLLAFKRKRKI